MKIRVWLGDLEAVWTTPAPRAPRRKTVTQILRAAYRRHGRDRHTRRAVRRCLR